MAYVNLQGDPVDVSGMKEVSVSGTPVPSQPVEQLSPNPYLRTTIPLTFGYQPDTLRQYPAKGTTDFRIATLSPSANPVLNAQAQSVVNNTTNISSTATGLNWRGVWLVFGSYAVNDVVTYNTSTYVAVKASVNAEPDISPTIWSLVSENLVFNGTYVPPVTVGGYGTFDHAYSNNSFGSTATVGPLTPALPGSEIALFICEANTGNPAQPAGWAALAPGLLFPSPAWVQTQTSGVPFTATCALGSPLTWVGIVLLFGTGVPNLTATITQLAISSNNILTVTCNNNFLVGTQATLGGITTESALNGYSAVILTASPTQFTMPYNHVQYGPAPDTGTATNAGVVQSVSTSLGNVSNATLTLPNPVTPGNTLLAISTGHDAGGFGAGAGFIATLTGATPSTWTINNAVSVGSDKPSASVAFVQSVTSGQSITLGAAVSFDACIVLLVELAAGSGLVGSTFHPYDVAEFSSSVYACLTETTSGPALAPADWGLLGADLTSLTTLGDMPYAATPSNYYTGTPYFKRIPGNTTATRNFLIQTGTGTVSAAPAWGVLIGTDIPGSLTAGADIAVTGTWPNNTVAVAVQGGVAAGSYTNSNLTVDSHGIITAVASGAAVNSINGISGALTLAAGADIAITPSGSPPNELTVAVSTQGGLTPGSYTNTNLTVDSHGIITVAANGSSTSGLSSLNTLTGAVVLVAGTGISITETGSPPDSITITATGGGGGSVNVSGTPTNGQIAIWTNSNTIQGVTLLPVSAGGTGTASPSLVAGTNVTITGAWPNQTISSTGGGGGGTGGYPQLGSGQIQMSLAAAPVNVNLTTQGTIDWFWNGSGGDMRTQGAGACYSKATGGFQICNSFQWLYGGQACSIFGQNFAMSVTFSDTAASQELTASLGGTGVSTTAGGVGYGFRFVVPADTYSRTLNLYFGAWSSAIQCSAYFTDELYGSPPTPDTVSFDTGASSSLEKTLTLVYNSSHDGQDMVVTVAATANHGNTPNVKFNSATLAYTAGFSPISYGTTTVNGLKGAVTIAAGTNIGVSVVGSTITVNDTFALSVNGSAAFSTANFNNTTPAAPTAIAGSPPIEGLYAAQNVIWQVSGNNVSGYIEPFDVIDTNARNIDSPPAVQGSEDDEFLGPNLNSAWTVVQNTVTSVSIDTKVPSALFVATGTGSTNAYQITRPIVSGAGNWSYFFKIMGLQGWSSAFQGVFVDAMVDANNIWEWEVQWNSSGTAGIKMTIFTEVSGVATNRYTSGNLSSPVVYGLMERVGTTISTFYSLDGVGWLPMFSSTTILQASTFATLRLTMQNNSGTVNAYMGMDFIRRGALTL